MTGFRRAMRSPMRRRDAFWGYVFLAPFIVGFFLWQAYPLLLSLYYSFTDYDLLQPETWIGLENYQKMFDDKLFWVSLVNTAIYTAMSVAIFLFFSLGGALLLNAKARGVTLFRLVVYLPSQLPLVASAFIFLWIFEPTFGVANYVLQTLGLEPQLWLFDPVLAKPTLAIMGIWGIGTGIIIFLAGLQSVPESLYDAAEGRRRRDAPPVLARHAADGLAGHPLQPHHQHHRVVPGLRPGLHHDRRAVPGTRRSSTCCTCSETASSSSRWATPRRWRGCCSSSCWC